MNGSEHLHRPQQQQQQFHRHNHGHHAKQVSPQHHHQNPPHIQQHVVHQHKLPFQNVANPKSIKNNNKQQLTTTTTPKLPHNNMTATAKQPHHTTTTTGTTLTTNPPYQNKHQQAVNTNRTPQGPIPGKPGFTKHHHGQAAPKQVQLHLHNHQLQQPQQSQPPKLPHHQQKHEGLLTVPASVSIKSQQQQQQQQGSEPKPGDILSLDTTPVVSATEPPEEKSPAKGKKQGLQNWHLSMFLFLDYFQKRHPCVWLTSLRDTTRPNTSIGSLMKPVRNSNWQWIRALIFLFFLDLRTCSQKDVYRLPETGRNWRVYGIRTLDQESAARGRRHRLGED